MCTLYSPHTITVGRIYKNELVRGVQYLTEDNLKVVCAKFSTLGWAVLPHISITLTFIKAANPRVENSAEVSSCCAGLV